MKKISFTLLFALVYFNLFPQKISLQNHFGDITNALFNEKFMLTAGEDKTVKLWKNGQYVKTLYFESEITSFKPHPYEPNIILIHLSEKVCYFNLKTETIERIIRLKSKGLANTPTSSFTNDKKYIIGNFNDNNSLNVVDIKSGKIRTNIGGLHTGFIIDHALSVDNKLLISGDETGKIIIWDMINFIPKKTFQLNEGDELLKIAIDEKAQRIVFLCKANKVCVVDFKKLMPIEKFESDDKFLSQFYIENHYLYSKIADFWVVTEDKSEDDSVEFVVMGTDDSNEIVEKKEPTNILTSHYFNFSQLPAIETAEMLRLNELIKEHKNSETFSRIKLEQQNFILFEKTLMDELPNQNCLLKVWDINQQKMIFERKNRGWVFDMALSEDSLLAIVGSDAQIFDLKKNNMLIFRNLEKTFGWMYNVNFYGNSLVVNGQFPYLIFYNFSQNKVNKVSNVEKYCTNFRPYFNISEKKMTTISDSTINTWDLATQKLDYTYKLNEKLAIYSVLAEEGLIYVGLDKSEIGIIDTSKDNQLIKIKLDKGFSTIDKILITPDKKWVVAINDDNFAFFIDKEKQKLMAKIYTESDIFAKNNDIISTSFKKWKISSFYSNYWISEAN